MLEQPPGPAMRSSDLPRDRAWPALIAAGLAAAAAVFLIVEILL
jgi:hypothetical protein